MDKDLVDRLKTKGNEAFRDGDYDKALQSYNEAIELEKSQTNDANKLSILYSNSSQVQLKQQDFKQAAQSASNSLNYAPGSKKSLLRRGIAYCEMNENVKAAKDLRSVLKSEPKNVVAANYLRRIFSPVSLGASFRQNFVGHYLRRGLINSTNNQPPVEQEFDFVFLFNTYLLRVLFVSLHYTRIVKTLLSGTVISQKFSMFTTLLLPQWFVTKRMQSVDLTLSTALIFASHQVVDFAIQVIPPNNFSLVIASGFSNLELYQHYEFDDIYGTDNEPFAMSRPDSKFVREFEKISTMLTKLAYFDNFPDAPIPKVEYLSIPFHCNVDFNFLNRWSTSSWNIDHVMFYECSPNLSGFANFNNVISYRVNKLSFPLCSYNKYFEVDKLADNYNGLDVLKKRFPNLRNFVGVIHHEMPFKDDLSELSNFLKRYIIFLTTVLDTKKVNWCEKPEVFVKLVLKKGNVAKLKNLSFAIEKIVNEVREKCGNLEFIRLRGPSAVKLVWMKSSYSYSTIEMQANGVYFEIAFMNTLDY